jgi:hypothetical protein
MVPSAAAGEPAAKPAAAAGEPAAKPAAAAGAAEGPSSTWQPQLSLREDYRFRTMSAVPADTGVLGARPLVRPSPDHDMRFLVDGQLTGPEEHFRALLSTGLYWHASGAVAQGTPDIFATERGYRNPWWDVYTLSAEWQRDGALDYARVGRQPTEHGLPATIDGLSVEGRPWGKPLSLFLFGGRTVHFFETEPVAAFENYMASAGFTGRMLDGVRFDVDYRFLREVVPVPDDRINVRVTNNSYGITGWARSDDVSVKAFARGLDQQVSHVGGTLLLTVPSVGLGADTQVSAQLATLREVAESENPYFSILGPSLPHYRVRFEVFEEAKLDKETLLGLHLGWRARQLLSGTEGAFNRNSAAAYFQTQLDNVGTKGVFVSGMAEWNYLPHTPRNWFFTMGGSVGYAKAPLKLEAGTYYQRFKVNYFQTAEELQDTRTFYGLCGYRVVSWLEIRARYEVEILDRVIHSVLFSLRQDL